MYIDAKSLLPIENVFEVDDDIYPILKILWDKGYKTRFSCAGHNMIPGADIVIEEEELIYGDSLRSQIYILFDDIYTFNEVPEGFNIFNDEMLKRIGSEYEMVSNTIVECVIDYTDQLIDTKNAYLLCPFMELDLVKQRENLLNWAKRLPSLKENNLQRERKI